MNLCLPDVFHETDTSSDFIFKYSNIKVNIFALIFNFGRMFISDSSSVKIQLKYFWCIMQEMGDYRSEYRSEI